MTRVYTQKREGPSRIGNALLYLEMIPMGLTKPFTSSKS